MRRAALGAARGSFEGEKHTLFSRRVGGLAAMLCVCVTAHGLSTPLAASPAAEPKLQSKTRAPNVAAIAKQRDGTLLIAGRSLRCGGNRHVLDRGLPNLGLAAPGVLVLNPRELSRLSDTVRLFVYHHECGHHKVGGSELGADCWAVKQGVRDGWLSRDSLGQICRSFGNGPATSTHPSGASRCASLNRCFTTAVAALAKERERATADAKPAPSTPPAGDKDAAEPRLVQEPILKRSGMRPMAEGK
jgi:hypothetical protein